MAASVAPINADVRATFFSILENDPGIDAWLKGGNEEGAYYEKDIAAYQWRGPVPDMGLRIEVRSIDQVEDYESECQTYTARVLVWVYSAGGGDDMPSALLGKAEEALKGKENSLLVVGNRTAVVSNIRFVGRSGSVPELGMWRMATTFLADVRYTED